MLQNEAKTDSPCTFTSIFQLLSKICMYFLDQVAKDAKSMFTFEKSPLVAQLKFKISKFWQIWPF